MQAPSGGNPQTVPSGGLLYGTASQAGFFDFRGLMTDSSGNPVHIYDPRTGAPDGSGRSPISCNGVVDTICLADVDPAAKTMASLIPAPNQTGTTNNYFVLRKGFFHRDNYDGKVNYVPDQKSMIFGRFTYSNGDIFDPPALGPAGGNAILGGQQGNAFTKIYIVGTGGHVCIEPEADARRQRRLHAPASDCGEYRRRPKQGIRARYAEHSRHERSKQPTVLGNSSLPVCELLKPGKSEHGEPVCLSR